MRLKALIVVVGLAAALVLVGCGPARSLAADPVETGRGPAEVVRAYYEWYLSYIGVPGSGEMRNPLSDRAYRDSEYLTAEFVAEVDGILDGFKGGGYDPFLCAQYVPGGLYVGEPTVEVNRATVLVSCAWTGNPMASRFPVELVREDGAWRIADIRCEETEQVPMEPEQVVENFCRLYLHTCSYRNPLAERTYRDMPFLTAEFVAKVDGIVDGFDKGGYDPFLCAQDVPDHVTAGEAEVADGVATVPVWTSFEGHGFTVELTQRDGHWRIADVICR